MRKLTEEEKSIVNNYIKLQAKQHDELTEIPRFFAFTSEQLEKQTKQYYENNNDNTNVINCGAGVFFTEKNLKKYEETQKRHREEKEQYLKYDCVLYYIFYSAFCNYEYFYNEDDETIAQYCKFKNFEEIRTSTRMLEIYEEAKADYNEKCLELFY